MCRRLTRLPFMETGRDLRQFEEQNQGRRLAGATLLRPHALNSNCIFSSRNLALLPQSQ
jgi:hypothetical protein